MSKGRDRWRKLTRTDLRTFDDHATEAVLDAMARGALGRISQRGHALLRNPRTGRTMAVTRDSKTSKHIVRQNLRRTFPEEGT